MSLTDLLNNIFYLLYPKRCLVCNSFGLLLCKSCSSNLTIPEQKCYVCGRKEMLGKTCDSCKKDLYLDGVFVLFNKSNVLDKALYEIKYNFHYTYVEGIVSGTNPDFKNLVNKLNPKLTYIPMYKSRESWRGFNQSKIIALEIANLYSLEVIDLLVKDTKTRSQVGLSRTKRLKNVSGSMKLISDKRISSDVIIVDDIATSGATLNEAARTIKSSRPVTVWGLVLSRGT